MFETLFPGLSTWSSPHCSCGQNKLKSLGQYIAKSAFLEVYADRVLCRNSFISPSITSQQDAPTYPNLCLSGSPIDPHPGLSLLNIILLAGSTYRKNATYLCSLSWCQETMQVMTLHSNSWNSLLLILTLLKQHYPMTESIWYLYQRSQIFFYCHCSKFLLSIHSQYVLVSVSLFMCLPSSSSIKNIT